MTPAPSAVLDPVRTEILWSQLVAIVEEGAAVLRRSAFSQVIRESYDYTCVLLTDRSELLAQSSRFTLPGFIRAASSVMRAFCEKWDDWQPGDVAITNDPWIAAGHLHDLAVAVPIFSRGRLLGFSANIAHQADMGGRGYTADAPSIFEEGLLIPPMRLYRAGVLVPEILELIAANVRLPDMVRGDIEAQLATATLCAERLTELMDEAGLTGLDGLAGEIFGRSEAAMRGAISRLPAGTYENQITLDGFDQPLPIRVKLVIQGDTLTVDYAGSAPQIPRGLNSCFNYTYGYTAYAIKSVLEPHLPNNEGSFRPIRMVAPEQSLVNSARPAPGASRGLVGHAIVPLVLGALIQVVPGRVMAEAGAPAPRAILSGRRPDGSEFQVLLITSGGLGGRADRDGASCKAFPTNTSLSSIEMMESNLPLRFLGRELRCDSGGPGEHRGGLGQVIRVKYVGAHAASVAVTAERLQHAPQGSFGGLDGLATVVTRNDGEFIDPKARSVLAPGEVITIQTAGGGGYGEPARRDPVAIRADLDSGYVSEEAVRRAYPGFPVDGGTGREPR